MSVNIGSTTKDTCGAGDYRKIRCDDNGYTEVINATDTYLNVYTHAPIHPFVNLYLYKTSQTPTLTSPPAIDDVVLDIDSNVGITNGDVITIKEGTCCFQSIVKATTAAPGATLTLQSPLDCGFTVAASVETGAWSMNVNGAAAPTEYIIAPPTADNFSIHTITVSIFDNAAMDSGTFGGLSALANGFVLRSENGTFKNLCLCVNNGGFREQGFELTYYPKAPAGFYGVSCKLDIVKNFGTTLQMHGSTGDSLKALLRDDLTGLINMNVTIGGHSF